MIVNGHTNGHTNGTPNGHPPPLPTSDGHHDREDARMRVLAIRRNMRRDIEDAIRDPLKLRADFEFLEYWAQNGRGMTAAVAAKSMIELKLKILELGLRMDELDDKRERLDTGGATERHEVREVYEVIMPEARARIGTRLED